MAGLNYEQMRVALGKVKKEMQVCKKQLEQETDLQNKATQRNHIKDLQREFKVLLENLAGRVQLLQVSPEKQSIVFSALEMMPSVVEEKACRENKAREIENIHLEEEIELLIKDLSRVRSLSEEKLELDYTTWVNRFFEGNFVEYTIFFEVCSKLNIHLKIAQDRLNQVREALGNIHIVIDEKKARAVEASNAEKLSSEDKIALLAKEINLDATTVQNFFKGEIANQDILLNICSKLDLDLKVSAGNTDRVQERLKKFSLVTIEQEKRNREAQKAENITLAEKVDLLVKDLKLRDAEEVKNFFDGELVKRSSFLAICSKLGLKQKDLCPDGFETDLVYRVAPDHLTRLEKVIENIPAIARRKEVCEANARKIRQLELKEQVKILAQDLQEVEVKFIHHFFEGSLINYRKFIHICSKLQLSAESVAEGVSQSCKNSQNLSCPLR